MINPCGPIDLGFIVVGEAPGIEEEKEGLPFVGKSGKLLMSLLENIGMPREEMYITNAIKIRLDNNRTPSDDELKEWSISLHEEFKNIKTTVILTLGTSATKAVLQNYDLRISEVRGVALKHNNYVVIPTFHPSYILRHTSSINQFKKDLELAVSTFVDSLESKKNADKD